MCVDFVYLFARPFLAFEAFLSLWRIPVDAYKTSVSSQFAPHLYLFVRFDLELKVYGISLKVSAVSSAFNIEMQWYWKPFYCV